MGTLPRLIALYSPRAQSGKSTVARLLQDNHGYCIRSLATPVKLMVDALLQHAGLTKYEAHRALYLDWKEEPIKELGGISARTLMQTLGTEWRDVVDRDLWLNIAMTKVYASPYPGVIDDMRFVHEYDRIKDAGGVVMKVVRPDAGLVTAHASEGALNHKAFDYNIWNDRDLGDLEGAVGEAIEWCLSRD